MSSRKSVAARQKTTRAVPDKPAAKPGNAPTGVSGDALRLAAAIEGSLASGDIAVLTPDAVQALMAAACNAFTAQAEAGNRYSPLKPHSVAPTAVMTTASGLLRATNLAVFELGMWQSWTGR